MKRIYSFFLATRGRRSSGLSGRNSRGYITDNLRVASVFAVNGIISSLSLLRVFNILKTPVSRVLMPQIIAN
jgi:hypothetical protein